jgi:hypothetical protein
MSLYSPLSTLYFCRCNYCDERTSQNIQSIIEVLQQPTADINLISAAYNEALYLEPVLQVFLFPAILSSFDKLGEYQEVSRDRISGLFECLSDLIPERLQKAFTDVFDAYINLYDSRKKDTVTEYAGLLLNKLLPLIETRTRSRNEDIINPYTEITDFAPQYILATLLSDAVEKPSLRRFVIENLGSENQIHVQQFIQDSLRGSYGRLVFLEMVRLSCSSGLIANPEELEKVFLSDEMDGDLYTEPDLCYSFLYHYFGKFSSIHGKEPVDHIQAELMYFQKYFELKERYAKSGRRAIHNFSTEILFGNKPRKINHHTPYLLWGNILLGIAVIQHPKIMSHWLSQVYQMPPKGGSMILFVPGSLSQSTKKHLQKMLDETNELKQSRFDFKLAGNNQFTDIASLTRMNIDVLCFFYSPWSYPFMNTRSGQWFFPAGDTCHWINAMMVTYNCLYAMMESDQDEKKELLYTLLGVGSQYSIYQKDIRRFYTPHGSTETENSKSYLSYVLITNRIIIKRFLAGYYSWIDLRESVKLLQQRITLQNIPGLDDLLYSCFANWIHTDFDKYLPGQNPWLSVLPEVYEELKMTGARNRSRYALLYKCLLPEDYNNIPNDYGRDLINAKLSKGDNDLSSKYAHEVHLRYDIEARYWRDEYYPVKGQDDQNSTPEAVLARKIEKAICAFEKADEIDKEEQEVWPHELMLALNTIIDKKQLPDLSLCRLCDLYGYVLNNDKEQGALLSSIIELVFDYGAIYHMALLHESLMDQSRQTVNYVYAREAFVGQIFAWITRHNIIGEDKERGTDPYLTREKNRIEEWLQQVLTVYYYLCPNAKSGYRDMLINAALLSVERRISVPKLVSHGYEVKLKNGKLQLNLPKNNENNLQPIFACGVQFNPNLYKAILHQLNIEIPAGVKNLFAEKEIDIAKMHESTTQAYRVLAYLVSRKKVKNGFNGSVYEFRYGYGRYASLVSEVDLRYEELRFYSVSIFYQKDKWVVDREYPPQILKNSETGIQKAYVFHRYEGNDFRSIRNEGINTQHLDELYPSFGEIFRNKLPEKTELRIAKRRPVYYYLNKLLLDLQGSKATVTLTFIRKKWSHHRNEFGYLFHYRFGCTYLLYEHDLVLPENYIRLSDLIEDHMEDNLLGKTEEDLTGLLVSFLVSEEKYQYKLRVIGKGIGPDDPETTYPVLQLPFDNRNILWRSLMDPDNNDEVMDALEMTAVREGRDWFFYTGNFKTLGFPEKIKVFPERLGSSANKNEIDFTLLKGAWNQWTQRNLEGIRVSCIQRIEITENMLSNYLNLEEGSPITGNFLRSAWTLSGNVEYINKNRIPFHVRAESFTLLPYSEDSLRKQAESSRNFIIESIADKENINRRFKMTDEDLKLPATFLRNGSYVAYVCGIPKERSGETIKVNLVFYDEMSNAFSDIVPMEIPNDSTDALFPRLYSRVVFDKCDGAAWEVSLYKPRYIVARLHWRWRYFEENRDRDKAFFVGMASGRKPQATWHYTACFERNDEPQTMIFRQEREIREDLFNRAGSTQSWVRQQKKASIRALMKNGDLYISGNTYDNQPSFNLLVSTEIKITGSDAAHLAFDRKLRLKESVNLMKTLSKDRSTQHVTYEKKQKEYINALKEYLDKFKTADHGSYKEIELLTGRYDLASNKVIYNSAGSLRSLPLNKELTQWGSEINVHQSSINTDPGHPLSGPFLFSIADRYDADSVNFWLFKLPSGKFEASFKTGFYQIEDMYEMLKEVPNQEISLEKKWYYVGRESMHPEYKTLYPETMLRFEYGYGKNILVPASRIRYDGRSIDTSNLAIYVGDAITQVTFTEVRDESNNLVLYLDILSATIEYSESTQLFHQARDHKIIHLLHVNKEQDRLRINYVKGFDSQAWAGKQQTKSYSRFFASINKEAVPHLIKKLDDSGRNEMVLLGRFDIGKYNSDNTIEFQHVRFSFRAEEQYPFSGSLRDNDRVYLKLGGISYSSNDAFIRVFPPEGLSNDDMDQRMIRGLRISRRFFSVREYLLKEVSQDQYEDYYALVKFRTIRSTITNERNEGEGGNERREIRVIASLWQESGNVCRREAVVGDMYTNIKKPIVATVIGEDLGSDHRVRIYLELMPCVYVALPYKSLGYFKKGDTVRISATRKNARQYDFTIEKAAWGHSAFFETGIQRPVVLFPKDQLHSILLGNKLSYNDRSSFSFIVEEKKEFFTIGDFPDLGAGLPSHDEIPPANRHSYLDHVLQFMNESHPKIAMVGAQNEQNGRIIFKIRLARVKDIGYLYLNDTHNLIYFVSYLPTDDKKGEHLPWHLLSFFDIPAFTLKEKLITYDWNYHDTTTVTWENSGIGTLSIRKQNVPGSTLILQSNNQATRQRQPTRIPGPILLQRTKADKRFRYLKDSLHLFSLPFQILINELRRIKQIVAVAYAGYFRERHWVEIAPGRIVELPVSLVVLVQESEEISMHGFNWTQLNTGDVLLLSVKPEHGLEAATIIFNGWEAGSRSALGKYAIAGVSETDNKNGSITFGTGIFQLCLPFYSEQRDKLLVAGLDISSNILTTINDTGRIPKKGDVIYLQINERGLGAHGLPQFRCQPGLIEEWKKDPLVDWFLERSDDQVIPDYDRINSLLTLTNALPVTVEAVTRNHIIIFSRRLQIKVNWLPESSYSIAKIIGTLTASNDTILLRCGRELFVFGFDHIVDGVPRPLRSQVLQYLTGKDIWIRRNEKTIRTGMDEDGKEIQTRIIYWANANSISGLLCESISSKKYYWMPSTEIGWCPFEPLMAEFYIKDKKVITVKEYRDTPTQQLLVSRNQVNQVQKAYAKYKVNTDDITVKVLKRTKCETEGIDRLLVLSVSHQVFFYCLHYKDSGPGIMPESHISVTVSKKESGEQPVMEGSYGNIKYKLDLPVEFFEESFTGLFEKMLRLDENSLLEIITDQRPPNPELKLPSIIYYLYRNNSKKEKVSTRQLATMIRFFRDSMLKREWENRRVVDFPLLIMSVIQLFRMWDKDSWDDTTLSRILGFRSIEETVNWRRSTLDIGKKLLEYSCRIALRNLPQELYYRNVWRAEKPLFQASQYKKLLLVTEKLAYMPTIPQLRKLRHLCNSILSSTEDMQLRKIALAMKAITGVPIDFEDLHQPGKNAGLARACEFWASAIKIPLFERYLPQISLLDEIVQFYIGSKKGLTCLNDIDWNY